MLTKPGIDIKTEREGIELMVFFQYLVRDAYLHCNETNATRCRLTSQSGENLPFFAHFTKRFFQDLTHFAGKDQHEKNMVKATGAIREKRLGNTK